MLSQEGVGSSVDGIPEIRLREFVGCQSFRKQRVEFVGRSSKPGKGALFDGSQSSLHNLLDRGLSATTHYGLQSTLLLGCEIDGHGDSPLNSSFRVRERRIRDNRNMQDDRRQL